MSDKVNTAEIRRQLEAAYRDLENWRALTAGRPPRFLHIREHPYGTREGGELYVYDPAEGEAVEVLAYWETNDEHGPTLLNMLEKYRRKLADVDRDELNAKLDEAAHDAMRRLTAACTELEDLGAGREVAFEERPYWNPHGGQLVVFDPMQKSLGEQPLALWRDPQERTGALMRAADRLEGELASARALAQDERVWEARAAEIAALLENTDLMNYAVWTPVYRCRQCGATVTGKLVVMETATPGARAAYLFHACQGSVFSGSAGLCDLIALKPLVSEE